MSVYMEVRVDRNHAYKDVYKMPISISTASGPTLMPASSSSEVFKCDWIQNRRQFECLVYVPPRQLEFKLQVTLPRVTSRCQAT